MPDPGHRFPCEGARRAIREALGAAGLPEDATRHLSACASCRQEADEWERLAGQLRSLPVAEPPAAFWEALPQRVLERAQGPARRRSLGLTALAAAALLVVAIVPGDRQQLSPRPAGWWLAGVGDPEPWRDPFEGVRSGAEADRVVRRVAEATGLGPSAIQQLVAAADEAMVRRQEVVAWNLLDSLGPAELSQVADRLEKGADR